MNDKVSKQTQVPTTFVCLDTNAWFAEDLLHSPVGSALLFVVMTGAWRLVLPSIVEEELQELVVRKLSEMSDKANEQYRRIGNALGHTFVHGQLIGDAVIRHTFKSRINALSFLLQRARASDAARAAAFDRVVKCLAPNGPHRQEAKDSLLWEQLMELETGSVLLLVTSDSDFYDPKGSMLANTLADHAISRGIRVETYHTCSALLTAKKPNQPTVNEKAVRDAMFKLAPPEVERYIKSAEIQSFDGMSIEKIDEMKLSLFLTEVPNVLAVVAKMNVVVGRVDGTEATVGVSGRGEFDQTTSEARNFRVTSLVTPYGSMSHNDGFTSWEFPPTTPIKLMLALDKVMHGFDRGA